MLDEVKILLGIKDNLQDELLQLIEKITLEHFKNKTKLSEVPSKFRYAIIEIMVKRYNRIGAEGLSSKSIENVTVVFDKNDFNDYFSGVKFL